MIDALRAQRHHRASAPFSGPFPALPKGYVSSPPDPPNRRHQQPLSRACRLKSLPRRFEPGEIEAGGAGGLQYNLLGGLHLDDGGL